MKKIFTLLAALMLTVSVGFAQQNYVFWRNNGKKTVIPTSEVDSLTLSLGSWLFQIAKTELTDVTSNSFQGLVKVSLSEKVKSISEPPEIGICYSDEESEPTYTNSRCEVLGKELGEYSVNLSNLVSGTIYYCRSYVKYAYGIYYGEVVSFVTLGEKPEKPNDIVINGHNFVNLGLPSGLLWARTNIGASSASEDGDYFAWGETEPKETYSDETYKWGRGIASKYEFEDGKRTLDPEDDAATVKWGIGFRMPSSFEFEELLEKCNWTWMPNYHTACGYLVTGPNGNNIFLPAFGYYDENGLCAYAYLGSYWSRSSQYDGYVTAYRLRFIDGYINIDDVFGRCEGRSVRPVAESK